MTGFTNYTVPQEGAKYVSPIDLDLYAKSLENRNKKAERNTQLIAESIAPIFGIKAKGGDLQYLQNKQAEVIKQLEGIDPSNLNAMGTSQIMNNIVKSTASDPNLYKIQQRYNNYEKASGVLQDFYKNGKTPDPIDLEEYYKITDYYNKGEFDPDFSTGSYNIREAFNLNKAEIEIDKAVDKKKYETKVGNNWVTYEGKDPEQLRLQWKQAYNSDPNMQRILKYNYLKFNENGQDINKSKMAVQQAMLEAEQVYNAKESTPQEKAEAAQLYSYFNKALASNSDEEIRDAAYTKWIEQSADNFAERKSSLAQVNHKLDEVYKLTLDVSKRIEGENRSFNNQYKQKLWTEARKWRIPTHYSTGEEYPLLELMQKVIEAGGDGAVSEEYLNSLSPMDRAFALASAKRAPQTINLPNPPKPGWKPGDTGGIDAVTPEQYEKPTGPTGSIGETGMTGEAGSTGN